MTEKFINQKCFKQFNAFTLAEVLIVVGIIGIIAQMTIPTLVQNVQERTTIAQLKKAYSTLSQAYTMAANENGTPDNWGLSAGNSPEMLNKLEPYLNIDKDCIDGSSGCFPAGTAYKYLNNTPNRTFDDWAISKLKLVDGTLLVAYGYSGSCSISYGNTLALQNICGWITVDVNGFKKPNQFGKDTFYFWLTKYGIIPTGSAPQTLPHFATFANCKDMNSDIAYGDGCTAWVLYNDNMDYLHCNYLDWGGKAKCD